MVFGTYRYPGGDWSTAVAIGPNSPAQYLNPINTTDGSVLFAHQGMETLGKAATVVPSALTVQVINTNALQTTNGVAYMGVMHTQAKIAGSTQLWSNYFDNFVQFQGPRMLSAGKLALNGVLCHSYPLNMSSLSDFDDVTYNVDDPDLTWSDGLIETEGFAPIVFYNPPGGEVYEFLVTTEWRVRFDLTNPASASHSDHGISSDQWIGKLLKQATSMGNGVIEIAEAVANAGEMARRARPLLGIL